MINPTNSNRNPYSPHRHQKHPANKDVNFADLYQASATARASGTQVQRSAVATKEDTTDFTPRMARYDDLEHVSFEGVVSLAVGEVTAEPTFPASIHDLSQNEIKEALHNVKATVARLDFEGKTKVEKYKEIRSVYENYLGKDFEEPAMLFNFREGEDSELLTDVALSIGHVTKEYGADLTREERKEVEGYGGMSDDEMRDAIRAKYPANMTVKESLLMSLELDGFRLQESQGRDNYTLGIREGIFLSIGGISSGNPSTRKLYDAMMDLPADYEAMKARYDRHAANGYNTHEQNDMDGVMKDLTSWTGGNVSAYEGIYNMLTEMERSGDVHFVNGHLWAREYFS
jgi:hypothetical protein